ncbi:succinyl-diaminopimelate desuccinylase [Weissella uvarum]|uniref:M20/M25/M40 family metallo-hydrolase n=1 Tax=Weissella uvarum TaxID=1479233 RepID=UPI0019605B10|nr:M20/M25/M40 family metallo-hydrolase [Weissella uvarum]MBM7617003.1 succinyl-diaminopimelate desuccinylase [Weissella uvarum]MCM0595301.1 M20/M25/M40 family metallo-hydrolase [Weissella uvarum]
MEPHEKYLNLLQDLVAIPSVSAKEAHLPEAAQKVAQALTELGAAVTYDDTYFAPLVIGRLYSSQPDAETVILYNHYDVQPAEPFELWDSDPWMLTQTDDKLVGRGVNDDKGNITARLTAVAEYLDEHQQVLPVNIIFLIEGSEETASRHLDSYLAKHADALQADLVIWESGEKNNDGRIEIMGGNKGIVTFTIEATTAQKDLHSSLAAVVDSAAWRLSQALATLYDQAGHIQVPGFYDDVIAPNQRERDLTAAIPFTREAFVAQHEIKAPLLTDKTKADLKETLYFQPTLSIEGITSGWQGTGVKTVLPAHAQAKLEARLVPGMDPDKTFNQIQAYLKQQGFDDLVLTKTLGQPGYRSDMSDPEIGRVVQSAQKIYPEAPIVAPSDAGTGPMYYVHEVVQAPIATLGIGYSHNLDHAPNENIRLIDYDQNIAVIKHLIASYEK